MYAVYFNSSESLLISKGDNKHITEFQQCSSIKLRPYKKTSVYASHGSPSKAPCTTIEAILFESTKENRLLRGRL